MDAGTGAEALGALAQVVDKMEKRMGPIGPFVTTSCFYVALIAGTGWIVFSGYNAASAHIEALAALPDLGQHILVFAALLAAYGGAASVVSYCWKRQARRDRDRLNERYRLLGQDLTEIAQRLEARRGLGLAMSLVYDKELDVVRYQLVEIQEEGA